MKNLKLATVFIPIFLFVMLLLELGAIYIYAQDSKPLTINSKITQIIFGQEQLNREQTFPPKIVQIETFEGIQKHLVFSQKASDVVKELGIEIDFDDLVLPDDSKVLSDGDTVKVIKIDVELFTKQEEIEYVTKSVESDELVSGTKEITQEGVLGLREKKIKVIYEDGIATRSIIVEDNILKNPITEIIKYGTKVVGIQSCPHWDSVIDRYATPGSTKSIWMKYIMRAETWCDSGQNTRNVYLGLYQFLPSTYRAYGGTNIWDGLEQIKIVSKMYDMCAQRQWGPHENSKGNIISFKTKYPEEYAKILNRCPR